MPLNTSQAQSKLAQIFATHADLNGELEIQYVDAQGVAHVVRGVLNSINVLHEEGQPLKLVFSSDDGFDNP